MGVLYIVLPLTEDLHDYLRAEDVPFPSEIGRTPAPFELRAVLSSLPDITVTFNVARIGGTWQAHLSTTSDPRGGPWTLLNVPDFQGEHLPRPFSFEKGWPELVVRALHALACTVGPLVMVTDAGDRPFVVSPHSTLSEVLESWRRNDALSEPSEEHGAT